MAPIVRKTLNSSGTLIETSSITVITPRQIHKTIIYAKIIIKAQMLTFGRTDKKLHKIKKIVTIWNHLLEWGNATIQWNTTHPTTLKPTINLVGQT